MVGRLVAFASHCARTHRKHMFWRRAAPKLGQRILDLGGADGEHMASLVPWTHNVIVADVNKGLLEKAAGRGFATVLLSGDDRLPFADGEFDLVYCNSVIEHVSPRLWRQIADSAEWSRLCEKRQAVFAAEIQRVGRSYWVQTPCPSFPIEPHTMVPFLQFAPRRTQLRALPYINRWWFTRTALDWHLLSEAKLRVMFPAATILREHVAGFTKSLIAIGGELSNSPASRKNKKPTPASSRTTRNTPGV